MELAVLAKAVPLSEQVRYDPERRTMRRDRVELVLNPFDQRALRVALELRRPAERVTVVSLGPASARPLLREARALGADRAVHLCDDAFAGSDVLASACVLAAALRFLGSELVLAGTRSTDSDTGLVGPAVAAALGWPVVTGARALRRGPDGRTLEVERETDRGHGTARLSAPALIAVGEKIAKPLHVESAAFERVGEEAVETLTAASLGLSPGEVGAFASPTTVASVAEVAPSRQGRRTAPGPPGEQVREALKLLAPLLGRPTPTPVPLAWPPAYDPDREIVVLVTDESGRFAPGALGRISFLRRSLPGFSVSALACGPQPNRSETERLSAAGARGGYVLEPGGAGFDSRDAARTVEAFLAGPGRRAALVVGATAFGRELAGQLAALRQVGAVADAMAVTWGEGGLEWIKPSFGGRTVATIRCRSSPMVATMAEGLATPALDGRLETPFHWVKVPGAPAERRIHVGTETPEPVIGADLEGAEVVVAVGQGIGGPEEIARLAPALERWGAALVATRRVVDAGWVPVHRQLGLTGRLLAPRLAVLLGVRGAINHMVGWQRAGAVLAVNRDTEAEVFRGADVGIVGSIDEVLPALVEPLAGALGRAPAA